MKKKISIALLTALVALPILAGSFSVNHKTVAATDTQTEITMPSRGGPFAIKSFFYDPVAAIDTTVSVYKVRGSVTNGPIVAIGSAALDSLFWTDEVGIRLKASDKVQFRYAVSTNAVLIPTIDED